VEKDEEMLKWGDVYHMFKKSNFSMEAKEPDELQVFKNIRKSGIFKVETHPTMFPYAFSIAWILKNIDVNGRHIWNARKEPITSFRPKYLAKCYHIEKGSKRLDKNILSDFEYTPTDLFPKWYRADKQFKCISKSGYPTSALRRHYRYLVAILCRLYGEPDA
jgi:hypothetical protein